MVCVLLFVLLSFQNTIHIYTRTSLNSHLRPFALLGAVAAINFSIPLSNMRIVSNVTTPFEIMLIVFAASAKGFTSPTSKHQFQKQPSLPKEHLHCVNKNFKKNNRYNHICAALSLKPTREQYTNGRNVSTSLNAINTKAIQWVASTVIGGALGTPIVASGTKSWYREIPLPSYTPPNKVFMPVWTTLYTLMGIASFRIKSLICAQAGGGCATTLWLQQNVMTLSYMHYSLNLVWAPIFFGLLKFRLGHVLNVVLLTTLIPLLYTYATLDLASAIMLVPYLIWLGVATRLSRGICELNPTNGKDYFFNNAKLQREIWKLREEAGKKVGL